MVDIIILHHHSQQQQQQQFDASYSNQTTPTSAYANFNNDSTHSPTEYSDATEYE